MGESGPTCAPLEYVRAGGYEWLRAGGYGQPRGNGVSASALGGVHSIPCQAIRARSISIRSRGGSRGRVANDVHAVRTLSLCPACTCSPRRLVHAVRTLCPALLDQQGRDGPLGASHCLVERRVERGATARPGGVRELHGATARDATAHDGGRQAVGHAAAPARRAALGARFGRAEDGEGERRRAAPRAALSGRPPHVELRARRLREGRAPFRAPGSARAAPAAPGGATGSGRAP